MAEVRIDTGPVSVSDRAANVPRSKWWKLIDERRNFCRLRLPSDCRELLRFVDEAESLRMWEHEKLQAADLQEFIRKHLDLDPVMVHWAITGLRSLKPNEPIRLSVAVQEGKLRAGPGRPPKDNDGDYRHLRERRGTVEYTLARLRRDDPDMAARVEPGELSANAAAVAKGWRKPPDILQQLKRLWDKATPDERAAFEAFQTGCATRPLLR